MTDLSAPPSRRALVGDLAAVATGALLVLLASLEGWRLIRAGQDIILGFPPVLATWMPHVGPGTPVALVAAVLVATRGPGLAERLAWRPLLLVSWAAAFVWTFGLALVDGWQKGVVERLTSSQEYLNDIPKVRSVAEMLRTFTDHILTNQPDFWTTHVGAHPPGVFLLFIGLDRIGLGGGGPAGVAVMLVGASACAAVAVTLRALGHEATARAVLPYAVLFPGAVWVGVSADGMFAAVLAWGVALLAVGAVGRGRRADAAALAGGVLLGYTLYLSYGLALGVFLPAVLLGVTRRWRAAAFAVAGAMLVVVAFTASGFWWITGYEDVRVIYAQSAAKNRPYSYFVWADLAALVLATGPAVLAGLRRLVASPKALPLGAALLVAAGAAGVLVADLSGMSKAEVERIWLPFGVWLVVTCALLPRRYAPYWLLAQAALALAVNHLLFTVW